MLKNHWAKAGQVKRAGVLVPLFSVYSKNSIGIGDFSDLKLLADWCAGTANSILQLLPMNEVGPTSCPYDAVSSFALEPAYISLCGLSLAGHKDVKKSINEFGYIQPIIWNKKTCRIVSGHQRFRVLKEKGEKEIEVIEVNLDEKKEKAALIALNKISGTWDYNLLEPILNDLKDDLDTFDLTGFDVSDVDLMEKLSDDGSTVSDLPAEEAEAPVYSLTFDFDNEKDLVTAQRYFNNKQHGWKDTKKPNANLLKKMIEGAV